MVGGEESHAVLCEGYEEQHSHSIHLILSSRASRVKLYQQVMKLPLVYVMARRKHSCSKAAKASLANARSNFFTIEPPRSGAEEIFRHSTLGVRRF